MSIRREPAAPIEVFFSYSHKDEHFKDELVKHLAFLKRQGVITDWHDRRIMAGDEWAGEIDTHLNTAHVILLLISADFLASDYCYDVELKRAMERHEAREARVIPVILRPVDWQGAPFSKLQTLPKDAKPVSDWRSRDKAFEDVAKGIRFAAKSIVRELRDKQILHPPLKSTSHQAKLDMPSPPEPYIAHAYTLLQTDQLIGRQIELDHLTGWVTNLEMSHWTARILIVVAIGGMGKSALAWTWFLENAPREMNPLVGRLWWSFYEISADFDSFVVTTLTYVSRKAKSEILLLSPSEREIQLLSILDREPFLLVMDGLERLLVAYRELDTNRMTDDELDLLTGSLVHQEDTTSMISRFSPRQQQRLRKADDPRVGTFLVRLSQLRASRILITSRLVPRDLETITGSPRPYVDVMHLDGLADNDSLALWDKFGVSGSRQGLLSI